MQNNKHTSSRKLKICRNLLICFICITLSCVNVFASSSLAADADDQTETKAVEETVEYEGKKAADVEPPAEPGPQEQDEAPIVAVPFTLSDTCN